ncbi:MAG: winged helix-turn-helix transcriptional regulator [Candidatus Aramenus sp.]|jgi:Mn-dependent DtxR family transcriptional regulator|nr:winged helix-turn-helix transcriptional regulator [Candidatus Aramenus sp.]
MELTPRQQDILRILKAKGQVNVKDIAIELKISQKTAKGYIRDLMRLGMVESDDAGNVKLKTDAQNKEEEIYKIVQIHESEINSLKKEIEELKEEIIRLKKRSKA